MIRRSYDSGKISGAMVVITLLSLALVGIGVLAIWAYTNYDKARTDVDGQVSQAVADARIEQATELEAQFADREKEPNRQFVGPEDYGRVTFNYPKTWSVFVENDASSGRSTFQAYLNPVYIPPVSTNQRMALRVTIENRDYDAVLKTYESRVKNGDLNTRAVSAGGEEGTRLDGSFSNEIRGAAVVYKIRDKTLTIRTDADTFKPDFDKLIETIEFNR